MSTTEEQWQAIEERLREKAAQSAIAHEVYMSEMLRDLQRIQEPRTVLLTGFAPWQEFTINPSQQVVERLNGQTINGAQIIGLTLPVEFGEDTTRVFAAIRDFKPSLILSLGLAAGTTCLDIERFAINRRLSYRDDDQEVIVPEGPAAYFATIDVERIAQALREKAHVPARPHGYAGSFLCNHIMYQTLHFAKTNSLALNAGFIHLPFSSEQVIAENRLGQPSLPLESMIQGVRVVIEEALA